MGQCKMNLGEIQGHLTGQPQMFSAAMEVKGARSIRLTPVRIVEVNGAHEARHNSQ